MDIAERRKFLKELDALAGEGYLKQEQLEAIREKINAEAAAQPEAPEKMATMARATVALLSLGVIAFVLAAIFFVSMGWMYMSSIVRVLVVGFFALVAYTASFFLHYRTTYKKSAQALIIAASIVLAVFLVVLAAEYNLALGSGTLGKSLFVFSILTIVYLCSAYLMRNNVLALLFCGSLCAAYAVLLYQPAIVQVKFLGLEGTYRWLPLAALLLAAGWAHQKFKNQGYANVLYVVGSLVLFGASFTIMSESSYEYLWQAILIVECSLFVGLSIPLKSRTLLVVGILFSIVDIIQLYAEYFQKVLWWPIGLTVLGIVLVAAAIVLERNRSKVKAVLGSWS